MEGYFHEFAGIKEQKPTAGRNNGSSGNTDEALRTDSLRHTTGTMGGEHNASVGNGEIKFRDTELYDEPSDTGIYRGDSQSGNRTNGTKSEERDSRQRLQNETGDRNGTIGYDEGIGTDNKDNTIRNVGNLPNFATKSQSKRFVTDKFEVEMGGNRSSHNDSVMDATDTLQSFVKPKKTNKKYKEFENNDSRKQQEFEEYEQYEQYHRDDYEQKFDSDLEEECGQEWDLEL